MERKRKFNDGWYFHLGKLEQVIADGRTKCGACGGPSNATNEEGRFYPLPERFWAIFGQTGEKAGNIPPDIVYCNFAAVIDFLIIYKIFSDFFCSDFSYWLFYILEQPLHRRAIILNCPF